MTQTATIQKVKCDFSDRNLYNPKYIPLLYDTTRFLHLFGSAGSGKSVFGCQKEIIETFDSKRKKRKTLVIRKVASTLKDSVYAELNGVIYDWGLESKFDVLKSPLSITNKLTGVEIIFKGLDDAEKIKSVRGVDRIYIEEATELSNRNELDQLSLRARGFSNAQITLAYNPIDEHHWLNTEIHQQMPAGHRIFKSTYRDNIRLLAKDPHYAPFIEGLKESNPNYYRVYGLGLWGRVVEGLIYPEFDIVPDFPKDENGNDDIQFYGLDFGFSDPTALVAQHVEDALPKKKLINKQVLYKTGLDSPALVREFESLNIRKDVPIIADSAQPGLIKTLNDKDYKVIACEKGAGSILVGINAVRGYRLQIVAGSKEIIKEAQNYQKNEVGGVWTEEPKKNQVDHGMDAIRYGEQAANQPVFEIDERVRGLFGLIK